MSASQPLLTLPALPGPLERHVVPPFATLPSTSVPVASELPWLFASVLKTA
jgi:hypothetical protein